MSNSGAGVDDDDPTAGDADEKRSGRQPEDRRILARDRPCPDDQAISTQGQETGTDRIGR